MPGVDAHHARAPGKRGERGVHFKLLLARDALHEGQISPLRLFRAEEVGERDEDGFGFCEQDHAAGPELETVRVGQVAQPAGARPRLARGNGGVEEFHQAGPRRVVTVG